MPKQAKKATNLKITGTKLIRRRIRDAEPVRQGRKQVLLTPDASSWVRMMVINWMGNNTNCSLVHMISTDEKSHKLPPQNCQAQLPLRDLVVVECLTTFARIPFSCQPNPCQNNFLVFLLPISLETCEVHNLLQPLR